MRPLLLLAFLQLAASLAWAQDGAIKLGEGVFAIKGPGEAMLLHANVEHLHLIDPETNAVL